VLVVIDIETDSLDPTVIWLIVCRELLTDKVHIFREPTYNNKEGRRFLDFAKTVTCWIGHNVIDFDAPVCNRLLRTECVPLDSCIDTLIVSRLTNYSREGGHSLEQWGKDLGIPKGDFKDFSKYSKEMEDYCIQDTKVTLSVYDNLKSFIYSPLWKESLRIEHDIGILCNNLSRNGFAFDLQGAKDLHQSIVSRLEDLTAEIKASFPPRTTLVREITPKVTKHGTLHKGDFRWVEDGNLSPYSADAPFSRIEWVEFNPGSAKQRVERLNEAGWKPYEKTDGHKDTEKALKNRRLPKAERAALQAKLQDYKTWGWTTSEANLDTLPPSAPEGARKLVQWLVLDRRRSTLEEWISACTAISSHSRAHPNEERIHGRFNGIGAWTQRMSHNSPNQANIPTFHGLPRDREATPVEVLKSEIDPLLRSYWRSGKGRLLVGVDAESIQLRVLAHYMEDSRFTSAVCTGNKKDGSDPHSMNRKALGESICQSRDDAKTFIYAWLLGASIPKVAAILHCSLEEARIASENFLDFYPGLKQLKQEGIPEDAARGYFQGFDGRYVLCDSEHLMLAGYLQCGEAVIMKKACVEWNKRLTSEGVDYKFVNFVHDEWQTEAPDMDTAIYIAQVQAEAIKNAGEFFQLKCPMAGSFKDDNGGYTIGNNWKETH
jgi:DNA polymerase-1